MALKHYFIKKNREDLQMDQRHECQRCGRVIKSVKAIKDGMGKVCKRKSAENLEEIKKQEVN